MANLEQAMMQADRIARHDFVYQAEKGDNWRSFAEQAMAGRTWYGDCDDLASTALEIVSDFPGALDKLYRCCVRTPQCPHNVPYDHMVAAAMIRTGVLVIFGDTFGPPHAYVNSPHRIVQYAKLSEGVTWRSGHPI